MAQELIYTSAPRGLAKGSSGFCTVACTRGTGPNYVKQLESLSGYAAVFPPHHKDAGLNPVALSHNRLRIGGKPVNILSRVAFAGVDHTQRSNKFAYHLVLDLKERPVGGPAWVLEQGLMLTEWTEEPNYIDRTIPIPEGNSPAAICTAWEELAGDAGWAGVLAQSFIDDPKTPSFIIFKPGMEILPLLSEALRLVSPQKRWDVTFSTYFLSVPMGGECAWRCCMSDSKALQQARQRPGTLVLDLTKGKDQPQEARRRLDQGSPLIDCARDGSARPIESPVITEAPAASFSAVTSRHAYSPPPTSSGLTLDQAEPQKPGRPLPPPISDRPVFLNEQPTSRLGVVTMALALLLMVSIGGNIYQGERVKQTEQASSRADATHRKAEESRKADEDRCKKAEEKRKAEEEKRKAQEEIRNAERAKLPEDPSDTLDGDLEDKTKPGIERHDPEPEQKVDSPEKDEPQPAEPIKRNEVAWGILALGEGTLADALSAGEYVLPVAGISEEWQLDKSLFGDLEKGVTWQKKGNGLEGSGESQGTGTLMTLVSLQPGEGKVVMKKEGGRSDQIKDCLANVAYLRLSRKSAANQEDEIFVLTRRWQNQVTVTQNQQEKSKGAGKTELPEKVAEALIQNREKLVWTGTKEFDGERVEAKARVEGRDLFVDVNFTPKDLPKKLQDQLDLAATAATKAEAEFKGAKQEEQQADRHLQSRQKEQSVLSAQQEFDTAKQALADVVKEHELAKKEKEGYETEQIELKQKGKAAENELKNNKKIADPYIGNESDKKIRDEAKERVPELERELENLKKKLTDSKNKEKAVVKELQEILQKKIGKQSTSNRKMDDLKAAKESSGAKAAEDKFQEAEKTRKSKEDRLNTAKKEVENLQKKIAAWKKEDEEKQARLFAALDMTLDIKRKDSVKNAIIVRLKLVPPEK